jgi:Fe2+ or Zn2+ uptake regulation protein
MQRNTKQKQAIIDYLKSVKTHPDAETVYAYVRKQIKNISLGTVYRILKDLSANGEILQLSCQDTARFDGDNSNHIHFVCSKCNEIYDIFDAPNLINLENNKVGKINNYKIYLYGKCKRC